MAKEEKKKNSEYGAEQITVLEGLEPVRKRPGMYIGSTSSAGLHHLIWEVVDNSIDEAMAGYATEISVSLLPDGLVSEADNGRGIPVEKMKATGVSALETVLTKLHAGGKFGGDSAYKVSGGLHGVGVSVVNALSEYLKAEVRRDGKAWEQEYKMGKPLKAVKAVGPSKETGTTITFKPDRTIFTELEFSWGKILDRLRQQSYLTKGITISVFDKRDGHRAKKYKFHFEGGIKSYIKSLHRNKSVKNDTIFYIDKEVNDCRVELALQYNDEYNENLLAFANNIHNPEGGTHVAGFRSALTRTINNYARSKNLLKEKDENLTGDDVREGLTVIISVKLPDPQFEGQTKGKLGNAEMKGYVENIFGESFNTFLEEHPKEAEAIIGKCFLSAQARLAARTARATILRKGALEGMTLPGKLADCSSRHPEECELYIVEGDSAGGCFSANTRVKLADGRDLSFKNLVKEQEKGLKNYCYTVKNDGQVGIELITNVRKTKTNAEVIKIVLDNNEEIICTPDHKFMLRNGDYKMAKDLTPENSLMPLYEKLSKKEGRIAIEGYKMILNPQSSTWVFAHALADQYNLEHHVYVKNDGPNRHHCDFNKLNNSPDNIIRMTRKEHLAYHQKMIKYSLHREDVKEKSKLAHQTKEYKQKVSAIMSTPEMKKILSERAKKQWQNEEYKEYMAGKFLEFYKNNADYRENNNKLLNEAQKEYWSNTENRQEQAARVTNYFKENPEAKEQLQKIAKQEWLNKDLLLWRAEKTKSQWTPAFRENRQKAYAQTYYHHALSLLKELQEKYGTICWYETIRKEERNNNLLKIQTVIDRYFDGNQTKLYEAVQLYNHKIKKIVPLKKRLDVYDLEVPRTHNFALASGIFVHNSAKQGRNRKFQAILPLRGKILNVERARLDKMLANNEIKNLVIALGTNIDDQFDLEKLRYHRIIIMTDADVDGAHIRTLLLTLFFRHFTPLVTSGHMYIAQPPLYQLKKGAAVRYAYSDEEKDQIIIEMGGGVEEAVEVGEENDEGETLEVAEEETEIAEEETAGKKGKKGEEDKKKVSKITIQRYKGLGEMNPGQLWETTMDPERRIVKQVTIEDAAKADQIFDMLMGDNVAPRKNFIQTHAKKVQNLDI
jgi:DNA gyrase subunit B